MASLVGGLRWHRRVAHSRRSTASRERPHHIYEQAHEGRGGMSRSITTIPRGPRTGAGDDATRRRCGGDARARRTEEKSRRASPRRSPRSEPQVQRRRDNDRKKIPRKSSRAGAVAERCARRSCERAAEPTLVAAVVRACSRSRSRPLRSCRIPQHYREASGRIRGCSLRRRGTENIEALKKESAREA